MPSGFLCPSGGLWVLDSLVGTGPFWTLFNTDTLRQGLACAPLLPKISKSYLGNFWSPFGVPSSKSFCFMPHFPSLGRFLSTPFTCPDATSDTHVLWCPHGRRDICGTLRFKMLQPNYFQVPLFRVVGRSLWISLPSASTASGGFDDILGWKMWWWLIPVAKNFYLIYHLG